MVLAYMTASFGLAAQICPVALTLGPTGVAGCISIGVLAIIGNFLLLFLRTTGAPGKQATLEP